MWILDFVRGCVDDCFSTKPFCDLAKTVNNDKPNYECLLARNNWINLRVNILLNW